ncbi:hypothetical protein [Scytonema hofmannii]|uniref:hypothetical protein n=1 Tax=Scytonema hofmannii TaxID=34078 RepID=UPI00037D8C2D|nr:hypothetical protein [Scytonema hofmannii]
MTSKNANQYHRFMSQVPLYLKLDHDEETKASRENYTAIITLLGSFILMCGASVIACTFFPPSSTQDHTSTSNLDITPMLTPTQVIGK